MSGNYTNRTTEQPYPHTSGKPLHSPLPPLHAQPVPFRIHVPGSCQYRPVRSIPKTIFRVAFCVRLILLSLFSFLNYRFQNLRCFIGCFSHGIMFLFQIYIAYPASPLLRSPLYCFCR